MKKTTPIILIVLGLAAALAFYFIKSAGSPKIRNVVLISIDTCRADYLSCYGFPKKTTPIIDAFAEEATLFEHTVSPIPITLPAHCSMLTGKIPPAHGVQNNIGYQLDASNQTLAEILKYNGFSTAAFISSFVLDHSLGMAQGFSIYEDRLQNASHNISTGGNERPADETTGLALKWLERNRNNKSFMFLHYYDPHDAYAPPEPFATEFADNLYAGEIAFTDHCIGMVIRKLKELDMYDSTLLIIAGDHGEMLGEHGELEHSYFIYESAIKVPLLIKQPGQNEAIKIAEPVGLVDIVPTVCSMLKLEPPARLQGMDISPLVKGTVPDGYERFIYSESGTPSTVGASWLMSISNGRWKYIQAPRAELYDVLADRTEATNLIEKEPHRARILEDKLQELLERSIQKDLDSRVELDAEALKRLQSLGYVAGASGGPASFNQDQKDPKDLIQVYEQYKVAKHAFDANEFDKAKKVLKQLIPQCPDNHRIYVLLGDIAMRQIQFDSAIGYYRSARKLDPRQPDSIAVCNNLAWLQATRPSLISRDFDEAILLATRVCEHSDYRDPNALDTLAVAYAAAGDFPKAIETARKSYSIATAANNTQLARKVAARIKLYEQSKPYIEK